jgi:hypothetical protein
MKSLSIATALALASASASTPARAEEGAGFHLVWDDFDTPWAKDTRWLLFGPGPAYTADDAIVTNTHFGIFARSKGTNDKTGAPAFVNTLGHDAGAIAAFDHAKYLVIMNHFNSRGFVGFDAEEGQELSCAATISGQVYGAEDHPFGDAVRHPGADPRLGAAAISAFDPEFFVIFNFLLTNETIFAFYERPAFARPPDDDFAAFSFAVPVRARRPWERHRLRIAYDRSRGLVRWLVDGDEVYRVDTIGARIDRQFMLVDHGGHDEIVTPAQLDCGMALFDFLDGVGPTGRGLVQIDAESSSYFYPPVGEPVRMDFVDPESLEQDRIFGQGASMEVGHFVVESVPVEDDD